MTDGWVQAPTPIHDGEWVDDAGTRWRLRGERQKMPEKRIEHLLRSPDVAVLLFYGADRPSEVNPGDREALRQRMRPYLRERVARGPGDHTDFRCGEFKDDERRSMLVIEEYC